MIAESPKGEAQGCAEYKFVRLEVKRSKFEQRPKRAGPEGVEGRKPGINQVSCRR